jgi:hypothetical protein
MEGNTWFGKKSKKRSSFGSLKILIYLMYAGCGVAAAWFIAMNIAPYKALVESSGAQFLASGFVNFILWIPLIGNIFRFIGTSITWIAGFLIWIPIQLVEVLPGVLWRHQGFLSSVSTASDRITPITVKSSDGIFVKSAKNQLNNFIDGFLRNLWLYCLVAYVIDAAICIWYYPLIPGKTWDQALTLLMLGQWKRIDTGNLFGIVSTLFAVEIIVHVIISISILHRFVNQQRSS